MSEHIAVSLAKMLRLTYSGKTQEQIASDLSLSQSIVSRLLNSSYTISSPVNKAFEAVAIKLNKEPIELWDELRLMEVDEITKPSPFGLAMASFAVYTSPFIYSFLTDGLPNWLRVGYTHTVDEQADPTDVNLPEPVWWDHKNFLDKFNQKLKTETPISGNPFSDCYVTETLLKQIDSPINPAQNRKFQAIYVKQLTEEEQKKADLIEVATICTGYGSLLLVVSLEDNKEKKSKLTTDEVRKEYRIRDRALAKSKWGNEEEIKKNKSDFLQKLIMNNDYDPQFFMRGIEGSSSFDLFKQLWDDDQKAGLTPEEIKKMEYLMLTRGTIDYSKSDDTSYESIAESLKGGKKLVMVAHPPFIHNTYQRIKPLLKDQVGQDTTKYIQQYRYNFSQWLGPQRYVLYMTRSSLTIQNIQNMNSLLMNIERGMNSIGKEDKLRDFFYYNPVQSGGDKIETNIIFERACSELCFNSQPSIYYSTDFLKLVLELK